MVRHTKQKRADLTDVTDATDATDATTDQNDDRKSPPKKENNNEATRLRLLTYGRCESEMVMTIEC